MNILTTILDWLLLNLVAVGVFAGVILAFYVFKAVVIVHLRAISRKTENDFDDFLIDVLRTFRLVFAVALALIAAFFAAGTNPFVYPAIAVLVIAVATYQIVKSVDVIFSYLIKKTSNGEQGEASVKGFKTIIDLFIWILGALTIMSVLGYNITSIIAGLGIGGIAVALAAQNILGDVFSSFTIYFDRPFAVGDYIIVGDFDGTVEEIGIKSTRIRSLRGEEIIMSNRALTDATVQNFGRLEKRRVVMSLGFTYETGNDQLDQVPEAIKDIIESVEKAEFERIYFKAFGDSALIYELSYYVNSSDFSTFAAIKHTINLEIKAWLNQKNISLAYPTQQVYLSKVNGL